MALVCLCRGNFYWPPHTTILFCSIFLDKIVLDTLKSRYHRSAPLGMQYRCVEYGTVIFGCLNALGIPSRRLHMSTSDVETRAMGAGHVAVEAYLRDQKKWVFIDGQWGVIPMLGKLPLNGVQLAEILQEPQAHEEPLELISLRHTGSLGYEDWVKEYLYYFDLSGYYWKDDTLTEETWMLVPKNAPNPTVFQIIYPLDIDVYTNSVPSFYAAP